MRENQKNKESNQSKFLRMHLKRNCQGQESEESKLDVIRNGGNRQGKGGKSQGRKKFQEETVHELLENTRSNIMMTTLNIDGHKYKPSKRSLNSKGGVYLKLVC